MTEPKPEPKRPYRRVSVQAKRRQATIDAILADVPGYRRTRTQSNNIVLGAAADYAVLCCPACFCMNLRQRHVSGRLDRLVLMFRCDGCEKHLELTIEQHEGQTKLAWRF